MNYFIYPMKYMRITQNYNGTYSHKKHWYNSKNYKDYPIDDGGIDTGRDTIYCPCDEMKVTQIKGVGNNKVTNTIWLVSTSKVKTPTFNDYAYMSLTHSNDSDFKNIKVGTIFKRGQAIVKEGENVNVATHIHMSFGRGTSNDWKENSNGAWVIYGDSKKPEEVCYIDPKFTTIKSAGSLKWVNIPKHIGSPKPRNVNVDQIKINVNNLRARKTPNGEILGYINPGIYDIKTSINKDDYTWYNVENFYIAYSKEWAEILPKVVIDPPIEPVPTEENTEVDDTIEIDDIPNIIKTNIIKIIIEFIKKLFKK